MLRYAPLVAVSSTILLAAGVVGCKRTPSPDDLVLWAHSSAGLEQIEELVGDLSVPATLRAQAVVEVVKAGHPDRAVRWAAQAADASVLLDEVARKLEGALRGDGPDALAARDGLFAVAARVGPGLRDSIQAKLAEWGFEGLAAVPAGKDRNALAERVGRRLPAARIPDLGRHGVDGALLLLASGIEVDRMVDYLTGLGDAGIGRRTVEALRRLGSLPESVLSDHFLEAVARVGSAEAAAYLLEIARTEHNETLAHYAFNLAAAILERPSVLQALDPVRDELDKMLRGADPDDRWFAAGVLLRADGPPAAKRVLEALPDDGAWTKGEFEPLDALIGMCLRGLQAHRAQAAPALRPLLSPGHPRIARIAAVTCLKALGEPTAAEWLDEIQNDGTPATPFVSARATLGQLAANAAAALRVLASHAPQWSETQRQRALTAMLEEPLASATALEARAIEAASANP